MSTRALLAVYVNGKLEKTYFHHWDGYVSWLGNILRTFTNITAFNLNNHDNIAGYSKMPNYKVRNIINERSPIKLLQPLLDSEGGFCEETNFSDYWCLEYLYRINFTFDPKASYHFWDAELQYTKKIHKVSKTWKPLKKFIPLIHYEGVHYITENDRPITSLLYKLVKPCIMPVAPEPEKK